MLTQKQYISLESAFDYYNQHLFSNSLPSVLLTFNRKKKAMGYYWADVMQDRQDSTKTCSEIALNIANFHLETDKEIFSTLVHEMCHHWQHVKGKPSRTGYHNKEWADKMIEVGLMPSHTGKVGGKLTGQNMTHYIMTGDRFDTVTDRLLISHSIDWNATDPKNKNKSKPKTKYLCPQCDAKAWGKEDLHIHCGDCDMKMEVEE